MRKYLESIERKDKHIQQVLDEIYRLRTMACSTTAMNGNEVFSKSSANDKLGSIVAKIVDLEKEADRLIDEFYDTKQVIKSQMLRLSKKEYYDILHEKHFKYKSLYKISIECGKDYSNLKKNYNRAIVEMTKIQDVV